MVLYINQYVCKGSEVSSSVCDVHWLQCYSVLHCVVKCPQVTMLKYGIQCVVKCSLVMLQCVIVYCKVCC